MVTVTLKIDDQLSEDQARRLKMNGPQLTKAVEKFLDSCKFPNTELIVKIDVRGDIKKSIDKSERILAPLLTPPKK